MVTIEQNKILNQERKKELAKLNACRVNAMIVLNGRELAVHSGYGHCMPQHSRSGMFGFLGARDLVVVWCVVPEI